MSFTACDNRHWLFYIILLRGLFGGFFNANNFNRRD